MFHVRIGLPVRDTKSMNIPGGFFIQMPEE